MVDVAVGVVLTVFIRKSFFNFILVRFINNNNNVIILIIITRCA